MSLKRIFRGKALGIPSEEEELEMEEIKKDILGGSNPALSSIDFSSKIMNGENTQNVLYGKLPSMGSVPEETFSERINRLTNQSSYFGSGMMSMLGQSKQKTNNIFNMVKPMESETNVANKVDMMLGMTSNQNKKGKRAIESLPSLSLGMKGNMNDAMNKVNMALGSGNSKQFKTNNIVSKVLGSSMPQMKTNKNNVSDKLNSYLGNNKGPYGSFEVSKKLDNFFISGKNNKSNSLAQNALNKMFGQNQTNKKVTNNNNIKNIIGHKIGGNFESVALNRMMQQKGLPMFGDKDKDGLPNVLDCNPLDYFKQGVADQDANDYVDIMTLGNQPQQNQFGDLATYEVPQQQMIYQESIPYEDTTNNNMNQPMYYYGDTMEDTSQNIEVQPLTVSEEQPYDPSKWTTPEIMASLSTPTTNNNMVPTEMINIPTQSQQQPQPQEEQKLGFIKSLISAKKERILEDVRNPKQEIKVRREGAGDVAKALVSGFDRLDKTFKSSIKNTTKGASKAAQAMGKASTQKGWDTNPEEYFAKLTGTYSWGKGKVADPSRFDALTGIGVSDQSNAAYRMASMLGGGRGQTYGFREMVGSPVQSYGQPQGYSSKVNEALSGIIRQPEMQPMSIAPEPSQTPYMPDRSQSIDQSSYGTYGQQPTQRVAIAPEQFQGRIVPTPGDATPGDIVMIEGVKYRRNPYNFPKPWKNLKTGLNINYPRGSYDKSPQQTERFYQPQYVQQPQYGYDQYQQ